MASRPRPGPSAGPALTKTARLRQTRSATLVKEYEQRQDPTRRPVEPPPVRRRRVVPDPKKVEFTRPAMTKAMIARMKHAERVKEELERRREEAAPARRVPRRTPAPIRGDPRLGRERIPPRRPPEPRREPRRPPEPPRPIPERTRELARSINADVVQAEPVGEGPIENVVIPPRTVSEDRPTVISIPQPPPAIDPAIPEITNRSIQVIRETLNEQDAAETHAIQNRLENMQEARREFLLTVANLGATAIPIGEERRPRYIYKVPELESEMFHIRYHREHPTVVAAREFAERSLAGIRAREAARRAEEEFERVALEPMAEEFRLDLPFEEEFLREGDISWEEEEDLPRPSRIKITMRDIPRREEPYRYPTFDPEELERFFDPEHYPTTPPPRGPPPGRELLPPELWEFEDPWLFYAPPPDIDLIQFD